MAWPTMAGVWVPPGPSKWAMPEARDGNFARRAATSRDMCAPQASGAAVDDMDDDDLGGVLGATDRWARGRDHGPAGTLMTTSGTSTSRRLVGGGRACWTQGRLPTSAPCCAGRPA